jgi:ribosomal protein S18 acetylase RimI-like enzyme
MRTLKENNFTAISLSVDERNNALRLYKRLGFEIIKHEEGESPVMLLKI